MKLQNHTQIRKKRLKLVLKIVVGLLAILVIVGGLFVYNNLNYYKAPMKSVWNAGFKEKQVTLPDATKLNYGEGGSGIPLLLIHGQGVSWKDYMDVLPKLSEKYHIYAIDCYGHGESSKNAKKYSATAIGKDLIWFIENIIKAPTVVSGHSSGGLLTAWLAANSPENVKGIVLEDPPLFSCEKDRTEKTFAYVDSFKQIDAFLSQNTEKDYPLYYLKNCKWLTYFGNSREKIINYAEKYRKKNSNKPIEFFFLPPSITRLFHFLDNYDPLFGEAFYDCSWMNNFNHAETLAKIKCPSVLIHTKWSYDSDGILLAAMDDKDAKRACSLIEDCQLINIKSGHDSHADKPKEFVNVMFNFLETLK